MLNEARQALLLNRLGHGAGAITVKQALRMATLEGARCLGRDDIGSLEVGKRADLVILDAQDYRELPYHFGVNLARWVVAGGEIAVSPQP